MRGITKNIFSWHEFLCCSSASQHVAIYPC